MTEKHKPPAKKIIRHVESERSFQNRVIHYARMNGWRVYHVPDSRRATLSGYPDLTMWHPATKRMAFAELKRQKGRTSESQEDVLAELSSVGSVCGFAVYFWRPSDWDEIERVLSRSPKKLSNNS